MFDFFPVLAGQPEKPNTRQPSFFSDAEDLGDSVGPDFLRALYLLPKQSLSSVWQLKT